MQLQTKLYMLHMILITMKERHMLQYDFKYLLTMY